MFVNSRAQTRSWGERALGCTVQDATNSLRRVVRQRGLLGVCTKHVKSIIGRSPLAPHRLYTKPNKKKCLGITASFGHLLSGYEGISQEVPCTSPILLSIGSAHSDMDSASYDASFSFLCGSYILSISRKLVASVKVNSLIDSVVLRSLYTLPNSRSEW